MHLSLLLSCNKNSYMTVQNQHFLNWHRTVMESDLLEQKQLFYLELLRNVIFIEPLF
jgi:hypothetical protein